MEFSDSSRLDLSRELSNADREELLRLIPELEMLSEDARERCLLVWGSAWRRGYWPNLLTSPTLAAVEVSDDENLVAHTRRVMRGCAALAESLQRTETGPVDLDVLLEAAALHDVAKLVEYEPMDTGGHGLSAIGGCLPHAAIGSQWSLLVGSPPAVASAIFAHTPAVRASAESMEAVILFAVDQVDADASRVGAGAPALMKARVVGSRG